MSTIWNFLINRLVAWVSGLSAADFDKIFNWAKSQDLGTLAGATKSTILKQKIADAWGHLSPQVINWLVEMAVAKLRKTQ